MRLTWEAIQSNAITFSRRWRDAKSEEAEAQGFIMDFLRVFGVDEPMTVGDFEYRVPLSGAKFGYIDYLWKDVIAIEMKSRGKDLDDAFEQLRNYLQHLPEEDVPDLWMVCDFENIWLDRRSTNEMWKFKTKNLRKYIKRFADVAGYKTERIRENQIEVNVKAAEKMAKLHDALEAHGYVGHNLEVYLVRLLFCMFADDTGIFPKDSFFKYIEESKPDGSDLSERIARLFEVLNMPDEVRKTRTLLSDELKQFRYINGRLFENILPMADFNEKMRKLLLECADFDWNHISPAIFGAMFQGVMDSELRRELGAHYTSEENILKLINPLFMDELWEEFERVKTDPTALDRFHEKIGNLKFLDPACGCGNFLIITYRELRLLELEVLKMKIDTNQMVIDISPLLKVSVEQFYGIEIEDFPCQIATVGMWLIDHQMNLRVSEYFGQYYTRLPLTQSATIIHGNALQMKWEDVVPKHELNFILGNPPFVGARIMSLDQKKDVRRIFSGTKNAGNLDYVCCWYKLAVDVMTGTSIRTAFVSTNSVTQGEQVAILWAPFFEQGVEIDFGYRTFNWSNEAKGKAAVHCVIVGFSKMGSIREKLIVNEDGTEVIAQNINAYLVDSPNTLVHSRPKPLCDIPKIGIGNKPIDGGNYLFTEGEKGVFIEKEPAAAKWFRPWVGSRELINGYYRYCLWLGDCPPHELRKMPECLKRVEAVRAFRLESKSPGTVKLADTPTRFHVENFPKGNYIVIPKVSSESRRYIPIGYVRPEVLASDLLFVIPKGTLYHFGILTSNVHMAWMRAVCGRLESRYRYSKNIVYNNFPWPNADNQQKATIETLAQHIFNARKLFTESSLADLYDPLTMPPVLLEAHRNLDRAVMNLYGMTPQNTPDEATCVAKLMEMYQAMVEDQQAK